MLIRRVARCVRSPSRWPRSTPRRQRPLALRVAASAAASAYVPGEVVVGYLHRPAVTLGAAPTRRPRGSASRASRHPQPPTQVLHLPARRERHGRGRAAAPPARCRLGGARIHRPRRRARSIPNDPGRRQHRPAAGSSCSGTSCPRGVDAPQAWANLIAEHHRAAARRDGRGARHGVAYRELAPFVRSPDFSRTQFVDRYDFVAHNRYAARPRGPRHVRRRHVAEATNNGIGADRPGLRRLDHAGPGARPHGDGDASTIARGIRYAVGTTPR